MSFGLYIGDFITIGDKAWVVYQKCKSARGDYDALDDHVKILHSVLEDVRAFISIGEVPEVPDKCYSLVAARENCLATLEELDAFLNRHSGLVNKSQKRKFELAKFITKDITSLKAKLDHSTKLLQLSLQSLQMYSVHNIRKELKDILHEYRSGTREPTVVSQAFISNKQLETKIKHDELTQQIQSDLEDREIHPESISLNKSFIQQWLESTLTDGYLEESKDMIEDNIQPHGERASDEADSDRLSIINDVMSLPESNNVNHSISHTQRSTTDFILTPSHTDGLGTLNLDDASRPPSRGESIGSHGSKPDDWRPYDMPNPEWVRLMLLPLFNRDPFMVSTEAGSDLRIKRAFHQQDYDHRGVIADHKVLRLCEDLLKPLWLPDRLKDLRTTVYSADIDGDGQFNETEYMSLMKTLITNTVDLRKEMLLTTLTDYGHKAEENNQESRLTKPDSLLPWGWCRDPNDSKYPFQDTITESFWNEIPEYRVPRFTTMAEDARFAVEKIDVFEERWIGIVPREPKCRRDFKVPLDAVRDIAYKFKIFQNQENRQARSDLDTMMDLNQILLASGVSRDNLPFDTLQLEAILSYANPILRLIQGFALILEMVSQELRAHIEAHYYTKLMRRMDSYNIGLHGKQLTLKSSDWNEHVEQKVQICRHADLLGELEPTCRVMAARYHRRLSSAVKEAKSQLSEWCVYIERVEIEDWDYKFENKDPDRLNIWVTIYVSDGKLDEEWRVAATSPDLSRAKASSWEVQNCRESLSVGSSIGITICYEGTEEGHYTRTFIKLGERLTSICDASCEVDFEKRTVTHGKKDLHQCTAFSIDSGYKVELTIRFEDERKKVLDYKKLRDAHWMDILGGKVPEQLQDFDDPKWDAVDTE